MAAPKGHKAYSGAGRPKGAVNKSTANAREAIARLVDGNAERCQQWLDEIYESDGPKAAWDCLVDVLEYHVPKLGRTELTGPGGSALRVFVGRDGKFDERHLPAEQLEAEGVPVQGVGRPL